jgi:signal transduction histidine kinase
MWDHTRQRWYAASFFWTYSPLRLFSEESEIKYMSAFCDVILAELHRIEAQNSDRAKSDFISTISHELRSPLHGILGSVECLQEQEFESFNANLISQVEICGRTLMDIVEHLLDFSKINQTQARGNRLSNGHNRKVTTGAAQRSRIGGIMALDVDVALDQVTEEVVETAVYSFCCSRDVDTVLRRKVAIILDIDRSPEVDWKCCVALGAWKRICINLVSNALKYTNEGHIRISLKANPTIDKNKKKRFNVTFSVHDTGRGMSKDFLENHLFQAFAQEDGLVEGTGLGINLVAKIVKSFEGKIEVLSEKGVGSCFSVTLPLEHSRTRRETGARNPDRPLYRSVTGLSKAVAGITVGVIDCATTPSGNQRAEETARALLLSSVHKTMGEVGINAYNCTWQGDEAADMYFVTEAELQNELYRRQNAQCYDGPMSPSAIRNKPFIVLCDSTVSARRLRTPALGSIATGHLELVAQPAGPERLVKAVASALRNKHDVARDTAVAGAVKDIPAMVPHPDEAAHSHSLAHRGRTDVTTSAQFENDMTRNRSRSPGSIEHNGAGLHRPELKAWPDYKFPRIPTPSLNGSSKAKIISTGRNPPKQGGPKPDRNKRTDGGVSLLLVDDNVSSKSLKVRGLIDSNTTHSPSISNSS